MTRMTAIIPSVSDYGKEREYSLTNPPIFDRTRDSWVDSDSILLIIIMRRENISIGKGALGPDYDIPGTYRVVRYILPVVITEWLWESLIYYDRSITCIGFGVSFYH